MTIAISLTPESIKILKRSNPNGIESLGISCLVTVLVTGLSVVTVPSATKKPPTAQDYPISNKVGII